MLLALLAACGSGVDGKSEVERRELCGRALGVLEAGEATTVASADTGPGGEVTLRYAASGAPGSLTCRFEPNEAGAIRLAGLSSSRDGELSPAALFFLETYWLGRPAATAGQALGPAAYLAQQVVNAAAPAAVYALLALGYSLIYGLIGRVNLAFGEFCAMGTFAALAGALLAGPAGAVAAVLPLGLALGAAAHALVVRPLLRRTSQAFLVASLGLSLAMSEGMRLAQGSRGQWLPPGLARPVRLWQSADGGASVAVSAGGLLAAALAAAAFLGVAYLMRRTAFGRAWRACADDPGAAALVGVDTDRTARGASLVAGACAALAGAVVALHYGIVGFDAGLLLGFKALTAAVVGGIGSPAGAALGGALIGVVETLWAAYLPGAWREVAIFGLLAATLILRPHGLLGQPLGRENPTPWRGREDG